MSDHIINGKNFPEWYNFSPTWTKNSRIQEIRPACDSNHLNSSKAVKSMYAFFSKDVYLRLTAPYPCYDLSRSVWVWSWRVNNLPIHSFEQINLCSTISKPLLYLLTPPPPHVSLATVSKSRHSSVALIPSISLRSIESKRPATDEHAPSPNPAVVMWSSDKTGGYIYSFSNSVYKKSLRVKI